MKLTPDLLTHDDGSTVSLESWPRRRAELFQTIVPHEFGGMPPAPQGVDVLLRSGGTVRTWKSVQYRTYEVRVRFPGDKELSFTLSLWLPPGEGPFPVVVDGDGCWRYFSDEVVRSVLERDCIAARFDRTAAAADNPDIFRQTGLYRLFPDAEFGVCPAWAWAYHRCVDALLQIPVIRPDAIAITGHSRGGKTALLAGATDERISITNPNNSGIGGAGLNRLKMQGSETINSFFGSRNIFWFGKSFADYRHRDADLPYDNHFLHAMVAPRGLLLTEAYEDVGSNPAGTYSAARAAREVYALLGHPDAIGWAYRESGHAHRPEDYTALLDFIDFRLGREHGPRSFQRPLYPDLHELLAPPIPPNT